MSSISQARILDARAVLFDLDGTLINSQASVEKNWTEWALWAGLDPAVVFDGEHGVSHRVKIHSVLAGRAQGDIEHAIAHFEKIEVSNAGAEVPMPGAVELLAQLPKGSYGFVTSCWRELAVARLGAAGIAVPEVLISSDMLKHPKPAADAYLLAAERMSASPRDCVVFEDSPSGLQSALAAECNVVALLTTTPQEDLLALLQGRGSLIEDLRSVTVIPSNGGQITLEITTAPAPESD